MSFLDKFRKFTTDMSLRRLVLLGIIVLLIPLILFGVTQRMELRKRAVEETPAIPGQEQPIKIEYTPGEILVKFNQDVNIKTPEKEQTPFAVEVLETEDNTRSLALFLKQQGVIRLEKVFKGTVDSQTELKKFKQKFPKRKINEEEALKTDLSRTYKLFFDKGEDVLEKVREISQNPQIEYAEPNYVYSIEVIPNDTDFTKLWGLHNTGQTGGTPDVDIDVPEAWDINTGSDEIAVGVIDTGINYNHPDLAGKMWRNTLEDEGDSNGDGCPGVCGVDEDGDQLIDEDSAGCGSDGQGINGEACVYLNDMDNDDDENGYRDDIRGWDFINNDNDPMDDEGHGTHVTGIIGAVANNNRGVVGVAWDVKLLPLKFLGSNGGGSSDNAAVAIIYATDMGARLTNNSWGGGPFSQTLKEAIRYANNFGALFIAAAGNSGLDNDRNPNYPSSYDISNIISVAATNNNDYLTSFSNFGVTTVDLAAPGNNIYSTTLDLNYGYKSGTSMAAPYVTGATVLVWSQFPNLSSEGVRSIILSSVDNVPFLSDKVASGGRLNAYSAVRASEFLYTPQEIHVILNRDQTYKRKITLTNNGQGVIYWSLNLGGTSWLSANKTSGTIQSQSADSVEVALNATDLESREYTTALNFTTDTAQLPQFSIPVSLIVRPEYTFSWGKNIGGSKEDSAVGAVNDTLGNMYVLGNFRGEVNFGIITLRTSDEAIPDLFLAKYSPKGEIKWVKHFVGDNGFENGTDIAIDESDNIYVVGYFNNAITIDEAMINTHQMAVNDIFVAKFNTQGNVLWLRNAGGEGHDYSRAVSSDSEDNYYVSGKFGDHTAGIEYFVKFNESGNELWRKQIGEVNDIAVDGSDNVYVTGSFPLAKYDVQGNEVFKRNDIYKFGRGNAITLDIEDNVYLTGHYDVFVDPIITPANRDILVVKYSSGGNSLWEKRIYGPIGEEYGDSITTDEEGNVYVSGRFSGDVYVDGYKFTNGAAFGGGELPYDVYVAVFNETGRFLYFDFFTNSYEDSARSVLVDQRKNIYLLGSFEYYLRGGGGRIYSNGGKDLFLIKLKNELPFPDFPSPENPGKAVYIEHGGYIKVTDEDNELVLEPQATFEAWVKLEVNPHNYTSQSIVFRDTTSSSDYWFDLNHSPDDLTNYKDSRLYFSIRQNQWRLRKKLPLNKWVHLALTRNGNRVAFYYNGEFIEEIQLPTNAPIPNEPANALYFGSNVFETYTNLPFKGALDEVRLSNTVRNIEEDWVNGVYFHPFTVDENTLGLWRLEDNLKDSGSLGNDGEASGNINFIEGIVEKPACIPGSLLDGDTDCDCRVNIFDLIRVGINYGKRKGDPSWDPLADVVADQEINIFDLVKVGANFGRTCPSPSPLW